MNIFIADYLPLKNKGEEAILRGIESLYKEKYNQEINFFLFGPNIEIIKEGNVTSFPYKWCYPDFINNPIFSGKSGILIQFLVSLLCNFGIYSFVQRLSYHKAVVDAFKKADYILIGHNGFYNIYCSILGLYLNKKGLNYSVLGAGFKPSEKYGILLNSLDKKFFQTSQLNIFREQTAFEYVKSLGCKNKPLLFPDMAFFCQSTQKDEMLCLEILNKYKILTRNDVVNIGITVCENSISFAGSFLNSSNKIEDHRNFLASLFDLIISKLNCELYFIPHCIENGRGNDLAIADDIIKRMKYIKSVNVIREDLPVNVIRHIIHNLDFMIGERTHSVINSISMGTPFFMLTCSKDFRSHDIIGKGCNLPELIINLDNPVFEEITNTIVRGIINRDSIKSRLIKYRKIILNLRRLLIKSI